MGDLAAEAEVSAWDLEDEDGLDVTAPRSPGLDFAFYGDSREARLQYVGVGGDVGGAWSALEVERSGGARWMSASDLLETAAFVARIESWLTAAKPRLDALGALMLRLEHLQSVECSDEAEAAE